MNLTFIFVVPETLVMFNEFPIDPVPELESNPFAIAKKSEMLAKLPDLPGAGNVKLTRESAALGVTTSTTFNVISVPLVV
jgi:hypothetical protein